MSVHILNRYRRLNLPMRVGALASLLLFGHSISSGQTSATQLFSDSRPAMGTTFTIYLYSSDRQTAAAAFDDAFDEIERIEEALSNYRPTSELSRINRLAAAQPVTTDPEVFHLIQTSFDYSRRSDGAFDITVGPLMQVWGFFRANGHYPSAAELSRARASIGWNKVDLDPKLRTVKFRRPGMELDPGGIGKGYAVDQVVAVLRDAGITSALIDAGSSTLYALGAPPGKDGWKVLVPKPADRTHAIAEVLLRDNSLSTSGSYEKFFRLNGRVYCHIMDPRTGSPVQGMLQTTVIAATGTDSDALSTAMFVMGPAAGRRLVESMPGTSAIWITGSTDDPRIEQWRWPAGPCQQAKLCSNRFQREQHTMNRREFLGGAAATLAASALMQERGAAKSAVPASDQVNLAIIGPGSRGQQLMRTFLRVPGVRFAALCDIYEPRWEQARKITTQQTPAVRDYRELLSMKGIDAVIVSTPLSLHAEHIGAALDSGHHVYGEKSMALTVEQCNTLLQAVKNSGRHYQIGLQYHYAPWYREAAQMIASGKIGQVTQIYTYWHRNSSWRRPVPGNDPELERLINWRLFREYSGGLVAELGSHHINFANEVLRGIPESAVGSGGVDFWKDGREIPDNVQVTYRYPSGKTLFFSAITTNRLEGCQVKVFGTGGSIVLTEADGTYYYEPKTGGSAVPEGLTVEHGVVTGASYRAELPYRGPGEPIFVPEGTQGNPDFLACSSFVESIRENRRPQADEQVAWNCGVTVALGNRAIDQGTLVKFAEHLPLRS